jgi:hypothetical protein
MLLQRLIFFIQRVWFRLVIVGSIAMLFGVFIYGGVSHTLVPKDIENDYVPFVEEQQKVLTTQDKALPLDQPNRSYIEMEEWVFNAVAKALSFTRANYDDVMLEMRNVYFSAEAFEEYVATLETANIRSIVQDSNNKTSAFIDGQMQLMSEGVAGDRYSWLYDVPVTITYMPASKGAYRTVDDANNVKVTVRLQVGRVYDAEDPFAIRIDSWKMTGRRSTRF